VKLALHTDPTQLAQAARTRTATLFAAPITPDAEPGALVTALGEAGYRAWTYCPAREGFVPWSAGAIDGHGLVFCVHPTQHARLERAAPVRDA
jgi:hypothetical protein